MMGHLGLLIQDYVAGIPIWYNPNRVRKIKLKTYNFVDISNTAIPTVLGGSTTASPPIVIVILR
jgi:hypothetical protein